jgi:hypothetical protein
MPPSPHGWPQLLENVRTGYVVGTAFRVSMRTVKDQSATPFLRDWGANESASPVTCRLMIVRASSSDFTRSGRNQNQIGQPQLLMPTRPLGFIGVGTQSGR